MSGLNKSMLGVLILMATISLAQAVEISDALRTRTEKAITRIETEGPELGFIMAALREANASYMPEIVAPIDVTKYQDPEAQRLIIGVYQMDLTYAATFDQRQATAQYGQAIYELFDKLGFPNPELAKQYREALQNIDLPGGEERLRELIKKQDANEDWKSMLRSGDGLDLVVDGLFAYIIEGVYLTCEMATLSDYDPTFLKCVSDLKGSFILFQELLAEYDDDPDFAAVTAASKRGLAIQEILTQFGDAAEITPVGVKKLRPLVAAIRKGIVQ